MLFIIRNIVMYKTLEEFQVVDSVEFSFSNIRIKEKKSIDIISLFQF